jgi:glycogen debranching enzyme
MEIILLWIGIVAVVRHLMSERLFSGWGVRTLAVGEGRYNPIGYHVGTIWPFDNSFIAWGLRATASKPQRHRSPRASWRPRSSSTVGSPKRSAATHAR